MGIQYASDIADLYNNPKNEEHLKPYIEDGKVPPKKKITIVHSRDRFLPLYKQEMHDEIMRRLEILGVEVVLGERLPLPPIEEDKPGEMKKMKLKDGREIEYDYLVRSISSSFSLRFAHLSFPLFLLLFASLSLPSLNSIMHSSSDLLECALCPVKTAQRCGACGEVAFCSREHQKIVRLSALFDVRYEVG